MAGARCSACSAASQWRYTGDVLHGDQVLHGRSVALTFHPGPADDYCCISGKAGKCHADAIIQSTDLPHCPFILQSGHWLLHTKNNNVFPSNTDRSRALLHGLLRILHLEKVAVRRENGDGAAVAHARWTTRPAREKRTLTAAQPRFTSRGEFTTIHRARPPAAPDYATPLLKNFSAIHFKFSR